MLWINFLHFYQPANSDPHVIKEATDLSYLRIIRALEEHPKIKFTLNITGCLFLRWQELGYNNLIERLNKLVKRKQVELVGSVAYHPIMPLISTNEAMGQIKENEAILKKFFNKSKRLDLKLKGFFLPELAYSPATAKIIKRMNYEWLILDEIAYNGKLNQVDFNKIYQDSVSGLKIIFRSRRTSKSYVPDTLRSIVKSSSSNQSLKIKNGALGERGKIFITATDGELYGLRHNDPTSEFEKLLKYNKLITLTISEFINKHKTVEKIKPLACSWESTEVELEKKMPYALWLDKKNTIQNKIWQLADVAVRTVEHYKKDDNYYWARWHLVRGLASCTFWWASAKDFRMFGPISWNPDEIERGINELIRSIRTLDDVTTRLTKIKAEKLYLKIKQMVWQKHWTYYWKKN